MAPALGGHSISVRPEFAIIRYQPEMWPQIADRAVDIEIKAFNLIDNPDSREFTKGFRQKTFNEPESSASLLYNGTELNGFAYGRTTGPSAHLELVAIDPHYQRLGLVSLIMADQESAYRAAGCFDFTLNALRSEGFADTLRYAYGLRVVESETQGPHKKLRIKL